MIIWLYGLTRKLKRALAANREPHLLSRAVACGYLLGMIPAGNLTSLAVLLLVFCLRLNHPVAALTAVATSFVAPVLDPLSNWIGIQILSHPPSFELASHAWKLPLIAWTNLNNSVVLGSLVGGLVLYWPIQKGAHSLFTRFIQISSSSDESQEDSDFQKEHKPSLAGSSAPSNQTLSHRPDQLTPSDTDTTPQIILSLPQDRRERQDHGRNKIVHQELDAQQEEKTEIQSVTPNVSWTRIDAVRIKPARPSSTDARNAKNSGGNAHPMDPQLRKLLSRLREQARRKAS